MLFANYIIFYNNYLTLNIFSMKKIKTVFVILFLFFTIKAKSQSFVAGNYYDQQYQIQDICNGCFCQQAVWNSFTGTQWVYIWNGWQFQYVQQTGTYWAYSWVNYRRC